MGKNILLLFFCINSVGVWSQVVNTGILTVAPDTEFSIGEDFDNRVLGEVENNGVMYVFGNYNNDGIIGFNNVAQGLTFFESDKNQLITGSKFVDFKHFVINNTSEGTALNLENDISVSGDLDFVNGVIVSNDRVSFEKNAEAANSSEISHIQGGVVKNGAGNFAYPIWNGNSFSYISIDARDNSSFFVNYYTENSDPAYSHSQKEFDIEIVNSAQYWTVEELVGKPEGVLTLGCDQKMIDLLGLKSDLSDLGIVGWDFANGRWTNLNGAVADGKISIPVNIKQFSVFTTAKINTINQASITVNNGISPNGDGKNDYLVIEGLEAYPDNTLEVFNIWGQRVYRTTSYGSRGNFFNGATDDSKGSSADPVLPDGTYFYVLIINSKPNSPSSDLRAFKKVGFIHLAKK